MDALCPALRSRRVETAAAAASAAIPSLVVRLWSTPRATMEVGAGEGAADMSLRSHS